MKKVVVSLSAAVLVATLSGCSWFGGSEPEQAPAAPVSQPAPALTAPAQIPVADLNAPVLDQGATAVPAKAPVVGSKAPAVAHGKKGAKKSAADVSVGGKTYKVVAGDTLSKIAKKFYHDGKLWKKILDANSKKLKGDAKNLKAGMELVIP